MVTGQPNNPGGLPGDDGGGGKTDNNNNNNNNNDNANNTNTGKINGRQGAEAQVPNPIVTAPNTNNNNNDRVNTGVYNDFPYARPKNTEPVPNGNNTNNNTIDMGRTGKNVEPIREHDNSDSQPAVREQAPNTQNNQQKIEMNKNETPNWGKQPTEPEINNNDYSRPRNTETNEQPRYQNNRNYESKDSWEKPKMERKERRQEMNTPKQEQRRQPTAEPRNNNNSIKERTGKTERKSNKRN